VEDAVSTSSLHRHVRVLGERIEDEMGEEQKMFTTCSQREMDALPVAGDRLYVSFDGGYVRARSKEKRQDGSMEIITGQCSKSDGTMRRFASVQKYDTKPKRRIYDMMTAQGMQSNQEVTFLTDGGDTLRRLAEYVNPYAERVLDWFHVTMRITQLGQMAKGIPPSEDLIPENLAKDLERIKWKLWHGNTAHAITEIDGLVFDLDSYDVGDNPNAQMPEPVRKMYKAMCEFSTYIKLNRQSIPNYGDRYRNAEPISSAIAESMVNQVISKRMCKQQQMRWTPAGAHRLLQIRVRTLDGELFNTFKKWYPAMSDSFV
jgi:hypothetical protein